MAHGHWHHTYETKRNEITIKGLDRDNTNRAVAVLHLDTLEVEDWDPPRSRPPA